MTIIIDDSEDPDDYKVMLTSDDSDSWHSVDKKTGTWKHDRHKRKASHMKEVYKEL